MTFLLDQPRMTFWISVLLAEISILYPSIYMKLLPIYEAMEGILAGTMFSLLGFVIAGLAIVISVQGSGLVKYISEKKPSLWKQLLAVFSNTAKLLTVAAFALLIMNGLDFGKDTYFLIIVIYVALFTFVLSLTVIQITKIIFVLEQIALQSSTKSGNEQES